MQQALTITMKQTLVLYKTDTINNQKKNFSWSVFNKLSTSNTRIKFHETSTNLQYTLLYVKMFLLVCSVFIIQ